MALQSLRTKFRSKPFALWIVAGGLAYFALGLIVAIVTFGASPTDPFTTLVLVMVAVFLITAYGTLREKRWGLVAGIVMTIVFVLLFSISIAPTYANPAFTGGWYVVTSVPLVVLVLLFSGLSLWKWKAGLRETKYLASHESLGGLFAAAVIGSLVIVVTASPFITGLLAGGGGTYDVRIVLNAPSVAGPYTPSPFSIPAGGTVTWYNSDANQHTVTSDNGTFGSPTLNSGERWSFTFTTPGTYGYHCIPHPMMKGTIIVT